ncbi:class I adenylate-forming enzyme family protein [Patulibacter medicamentivorans]|nr:AMP-binding protein [Patulibacter medicamentivorans]
MDASYPLLCACERFGDRPAIVDRNGTVSFRELERRIAGLSAGLRRAGHGGRTVGMLLDNRSEVVEVYMALARAGCIAVPINTRLTADEQAFVVDDAGVELLVADDQQLDRARELAAGADLDVLPLAGGSGSSIHALRETAPDPVPSDRSGRDDDVATIIYTSGTSGFPKGVARTHRANVWNVVNSALGSPRRPGEVEVFNLPTFGIGFFHFLVPALLGGATVVLDGAFDPARAWELLERHRATRTFLAPTMIAAMLAVDGHEHRDLTALELIYTAYAFPERVRRAALERFGSRFAFMYGLTEAQLTCSAPEHFESDPTDVGTTMGVSRVAVLDPAGRPLPDGEVGEIGFAGPSVMAHYHGRPDATAEAVRAGWVLTGDLGRRDEDGRLHFVGRSKEMIKTGGFSVDPVEVENAILALDGVVEAAVVGVEDEYWGEAIVAFVVGDVRPEAVTGVCRERLARFKVPKRVVGVDALPKNATGKIERGRLRAAVRSAGDEPLTPVA